MTPEIIGSIARSINDVLRTIESMEALLKKAEVKGAGLEGSARNALVNLRYAYTELSALSRTIGHPSPSIKIPVVVEDDTAERQAVWNQTVL